MFRAQRAHHQEVKTVLYIIWYHHTSRCYILFLWKWKSPVQLAVWNLEAGVRKKDNFGNWGGSAKYRQAQDIKW